MSSEYIDLKIVVLGSSGLGKTSYIKRWTKNIFSYASCSSLESEFEYKVIENKGKSYRIILWNILSKYYSNLIIKTFIKNTHGCIIFSNTNDIQTKENALYLKKNIDELNNISDKQIPCILIESKCDLLENKDIIEHEKEIKELVEKNKFIRSFLISSKNMININESMDFLINEIIKKMELMSEKGIPYFIDEKEELLEKEREKEKEKLKQKKEEEEEEEKEEENSQKNQRKLYKLYIVDKNKLKEFFFAFQKYNSNIKLLIVNRDDQKEKYICYIDLNKLKQQYIFLMTLKDNKHFIKIFKKLYEKNKIRVKIYLKDFIIQISIFFTSLTGKEKEIILDFIYDKYNLKNIDKLLIMQLMKMRDKLIDAKNKAIKIMEKTEDDDVGDKDEIVDESYVVS